MRLLKISRFYPAYLHSLYQRQPELAKLPYQQQLNAILQDGFWWADFYTNALQGMGYDTREVIGNAQTLQQRWAAENDSAYTEAAWQGQIITAQVRAFQPDILLVTNGTAILKAADVQHMRDQHPALRLALVVTGAPASDWAEYRAYDLLISNIPELVGQYKAAGLAAYHVHHAFAPELRGRIGPVTPQLPFTFSGSIITQADYHNERMQLIQALLQSTALELWSRVPVVSRWARARYGLQRAAYAGYQAVRRAGVPQGVVQRVPLLSKVSRWQGPPQAAQGLPPAIAPRVHPPVFGLDMYRLLARSHVTLNTHIDASARSASNMRLFEATGVGACLLTDWKPDLATLFDPEREVVTYRSADEAIEKAGYLLAHEAERRRIAEAGQQRTLRDHTVMQRAAQLDALIRRHLKG